MNPNNNNTLAENPNSSAQDANTFWNIDKQSLKQGFKNVARTMGEGTLDVVDSGKSLLGNNKPTGGYGRNREKFAENVGTIEIGGFGLYAGYKILQKILGGNSGGSNSGNEKMSAGTKLLIGGALGALALSQMDLSKLNLFGGLGNQLSEMNKKVEQATADFEKAQQNLMIASQEAKNAVINEASESVQASKKKAEEAAKKIMEEAQVKKEEAETLLQQTVQQRIMEGKTKIQKLEEELQNAKQQIPQNPIIIAKLESEIKAWQEGVEILEGTSVVAETHDAKEQTTEEKIWGETWEKTREILVTNGLLAQHEANQMQTKESFIAWAKKEGLDTEIGNALNNSVHETDTKKRIGIIIGIIGLLIFHKFKTAAGVGSIALAMNYLMKDENRSQQEIQNTKNAIKDLYELYSATLKDQGYSDQETRTLFSDILGEEILRLFHFDTFITPENAEKNIAAYKALQDKIITLPNVNKNELTTIHQDALQQGQLLINSHNEAISKNKKQAIESDLYYRFFLNLKILGITVKEVNFSNNFYTLTFYNGIKIENLPYNPLPEKISTEERQKKYNEKQYELLGIFEQDIASLLEYQKKHTEIFPTGHLDDLYELLKNVNAQSGINPFPQDIFDQKILPEIRKLKTVVGATVQETKTGTIFVSLPPNNAKTLVGLAGYFNRESTDPRSLTSADKSTLYAIGFKRSHELLGEGFAKVRNNISELYKSLPNDSPLKKHFSEYLTSETSGVLDPAIMTDGIWWSKFFILLLENKTDSLFAKIESGVFVVGTPAGQFALFSLLDPVTAQYQGFIRLFGDDEMSWQEYLSRSFIGGGIAFGTAGAIGGFLTGSGTVGRVTGIGSGFMNGVRSVASLNPLLQGGNQAYLLWVRKSLGTSGAWAITKERLLNPNSYLPMWVHRLMESSQDALLQIYANNLKQLELYRKQASSHTHSTGNHSPFANRAIFTTSSIKAENAAIEKVFNAKFAAQGGNLKDFTDLAEKLSKHTGTYANFLETNFPKLFFENKLFTLFKEASTGGIASVESKFTTVIREITIHTTMTAADKFQIQALINQHKLSAIIKQTNNANLALSKTTLTSLLTELSALASSIHTSSNADETKSIKIIGEEIAQHIKVIQDAIAKIESGKVPKLPFKYLQFSMNPFSRFNIKGLGNINYGQSFANGIQKIGKWGIWADVGIEAAQSMANVYSSSDETLSEGVRDAYETKALIHGVSGAGKLGSAYGGPIAGSIAYAVISGSAAVALGGVDAQMLANADEIDMSSEKIWTKATLLKKITFMASTDLDTDVKNTFHDMRIIAIQSSPFLSVEEKSTQIQQINAEKGKAIPEIRETMWKAMAIIESHESGLTEKAQDYFREAYFGYIWKNTNQCTNTNRSSFELERMHNAAIVFAKTLAEDIDTNQQNNIPTQTFQESVDRMNNPVEIPNFLQSEESLKEKTKTEKVENLKDHGIFDTTIVLLAKKLGYTGAMNIVSVQNLFFTKENKTKYGIYWENNEGQWKIHRMESLIKDAVIPLPPQKDKNGKEITTGASESDRVQYVLEFMGIHKNSVFTSDNYGTFENIIDSMYQAADQIGNETGLYDLENDANREIMQNSAKEFSKHMIVSFLEASGYKEKILAPNISEFEKGILIFTLLNENTKTSDIETVKTMAQQKKVGDILTWNQTHWVLKTSTFDQVITPETNIAKDSIVESMYYGKFFSLLQCMQIAKELSTTSPGTPSS